MTYEFGLELYASAWFGLMGTFILMAKWLREKLDTLYQDYIDRVDRKNGDLGLDRSIDASDIAFDYLLPIDSGAIDRYAESNDYSRKQYVSELSQDVGRPIGLIAFIFVFALAVILVFAGPVVYYLWGLAYAAEYLIVLIALVGLNLFAYLLS